MGNGITWKKYQQYDKSDQSPLVGNSLHISKDIETEESLEIFPDYLYAHMYVHKHIWKFADSNTVFLFMKLRFCYI